MTQEEKTINSERIYEGKILNLRRDTVRAAGGSVSDREIVEHNGGVTVAAITDDGKMVMVRQFRKAAEKVVLETPAGKREKGEDPLETAKRELKEETGYTADKIELLTKFYAAVGYSEEIIHVYLCAGLTPGETDFDDHEAIEVVEYDLDTLLAMVESGAIEDGKTIVAILMAKNALGRKSL